MNILKKTGLWRGVGASFTSLFALMLVLTGTAYDNAGAINSFLNLRTSIVQQKSGGQANTQYYPSAYGDVNNFTAADYQKLVADEYAQAIQEETEGAVLLKNKNQCLPLAASERKVTLFGHASVDPYYKANSGGSWSGTSPMLLTYEQAMKDAGFTLNDTLLKAYKASGALRGGNPDQFGSTTFNLCEEPPSFYSADKKATFSEYGDAAIVMLARTGGETRDLPRKDDEGISHLALHAYEKALLKMIKDSGAFKKTILLVNTGNPLELDGLDEYGVDAVLWIGGPGYRGFEGVAKILTGEANPSGRTVDTFAANSLSAPAVSNFGDNDYVNADEVAKNCTDSRTNVVKNLVYQEGIYVGYRYYETRYEDAILKQGNADGTAGSSFANAWDYAKEVVYPFGYGLSYTSFSQSFQSFSVSDKGITATIKVKNEGSVKGKTSVGLYAQTPYGSYEKSNKVEKSAVQLAGFAKTSELAPKAEETLTISVDKYLLASYDYTALKGYYLSSGDYYFALGQDAHDALNNILKAKSASVQGLVDADGNAVSGDESLTKKWSLSSRDEASYKASNGVRVSNRFEEADLNHFIPHSVTYLTRSDWAGSYPANVKITATAEMIKLIDGHTYTKPADAPAASSFSQGNRANLALVSMRGVAYDDALWEDFLNQLTVAEMASVLIDTGGTVSVDSIGKPDQINQDGPDGVSGAVAVNNKLFPMCYPNEIVLASSWNLALAEKRGEFLGEDALFSKVAQLWCPGADIHRTPFSGRNFEYYSEDPTLSYLFGGETCAAMEKKGLCAAPKHFVANDQETNRQGVSTFFNEQSFREIYLRGFEGCFTKGGASGVMTSYNRLGCTYAGMSSALQQDVLRGEWGFKGAVITDMVAGGENYQHTIESLIAGTDMYCMAGNDFRARALLKSINSGEGDGYLLQALRKANKNFYYAFANSNLVNGLTSDSVVVSITPWWQSLLIGLDSALGALGLAGIALFLIGSYALKSKKEVA